MLDVTRIGHEKAVAVREAFERELEAKRRQLRAQAGAGGSTR